MDRTDISSYQITFDKKTNQEVQPATKSALNEIKGTYMYTGYQNGKYSYKMTKDNSCGQRFGMRLITPTLPVEKWGGG